MKEIKKLKKALDILMFIIILVWIPSLLFGWYEFEEIVEVGLFLIVSKIYLLNGTDPEKL